MNRPQSRILKAVGQYQYLSSFQLNKLLYGNCLSHVQNNCARLIDQGLLSCHLLPTDLRVGGRARQIYSITKKAVVELDGPYCFGSERPSPPNLRHTLAINDILILLATLPQIYLENVLTEWQLKKTPSGGVCPDACCQLEAFGHQYAVAFEIDKGTEERKIFKAKLKALVSYTQDHYKRHMDCEFLTIAFVDASGIDRRLNEMIRWAEQVLTYHNAEALAPIFHFRAVDTENVEAEDFFFTKEWRVPFSDTKVAIMGNHE